MSNFSHLTDDDRAAMLYLNMDQGISKREISRLYGVSHTTVQRTIKDAQNSKKIKALYEKLRNGTHEYVGVPLEESNVPTTDDWLAQDFDDEQRRLQAVTTWGLYAVLVLLVSLIALAIYIAH